MPKTSSRNPKPVHQLSSAEFDKMFPDEDACKAYLTGNRWPSGVHCPRCGNVDVSVHGTMPFHWQCGACSPSETSYRFSVIAGTVFENTNKPLRDWFKVTHLMLTSKKGMSALQIYRYMGFGSYKTAWYMCHRIRAGLHDKQFRKLMGIVEVDETYIGGKDHNRHWNKKSRGVGGEGSQKFIVIGAVQRHGGVVARVIENTKTEAFEGFVREFVSTKVSLLATDEHSGYRKLSPDYPHHAIRHEAHTYVHGNIHTNTIEGFWSILKRGVVGTFHKVSRKYLPLYVAEFEFRYNNRENADIFGAAISGF